jgi:hypothetical protein
MRKRSRAARRGSHRRLLEERLENSTASENHALPKMAIVCRKDRISYHDAIFFVAKQRNSSSFSSSADSAEKEPFKSRSLRI